MPSVRRSCAPRPGGLGRGAGAQQLEPLREQDLEVLDAAPLEQHVPVGTGRLAALRLGPGPVHPQRLGAAHRALPDLGHVGLEGERDGEAVVAGAVVGHALPRRHLDPEVGLVALGTQPRAAQCSLGHVGLLLGDPRRRRSRRHRCDLRHTVDGSGHLSYVGRTSGTPEDSRESAATRRRPCAAVRTRARDDAGCGCFSRDQARGAVSDPRAAGREHVRSVSSRSVIMPSTPRSSSRCISAGVVDRPDVHPLAAAVGEPDQARRDHPERPDPVGDLGARGLAAAARPARPRRVRGGGPQQRHPAGAQRGAQAGSAAARRTAASRRSENDATQTRSSAPVRRTASTSGPMALASLTSMLTRTSGQVPEQVLEQRDRLAAADPGRPHRVQGSSATRPARSVTRSRVRSWKASSTPSAVACTSVSR